MRSKIQVAVVALAALCLCPALALAQNGTISGKVTTNGGATNLAGITVQALTASNAVAGTAVTNPTGDYTILNLPPSQYRLRTAGTVAQPGYINKIYPNFSCALVPCTIQSAGAAGVVQNLPPFGALTNRNFDLALGTRVSGTVTSGPTPQNGVPVLIVIPGPNQFQDVTIALLTTNALGVFTSLEGFQPNATVFARTNITNVPSPLLINEAYNNVTCPPNCLASVIGSPIALGAAGTTKGNIDFDLVLGGAITGTVTRQTDASPVFCPSACFVTIVDGMSNFVGSGTMTTNTGVFTVSRLVPGTYYAVTNTASNLQLFNEIYDNKPCVGFCDPTTGTPITVTSGNTTTGIDFQLTQSGGISGTVTRAADGTGVFCSSSCGVVVVDANNNQVGLGTLSTTGAYTVSSLAPGTYYARTSSGNVTPPLVDEIYNNIPCISFCDATTGTGIVVTSGNVTTGIDFQLIASARISGTITNASTNATVQGVTVAIWDSSGGFVQQVGSNSSGVFQTAGGLLAGTYYATTSNSLGLLNETWDNILCGSFCSATTGTPIVLATGQQRTDINFALTPSGSITGTVTDTNGNLLQGITVQIVNAANSQVGSANTNASGVYTVAGLATGDHYVRTSNSAGFINQVYSGVSCGISCPTLDGTKVPVVAGTATTNINLKLQAGGRVSGTITQPGGAPIAGVSISIISGTTTVANASTNASGFYITGVGLQPGTYTVRTGGTHDFMNELYDNIPCFGCNAAGGTPVEVALGTTTAGINFELAPAGKVTGRIVDNAATPASIAQVTVILSDASGGFAGFAFTSSAGTFTLPGLPSGNYFLNTSNSAGFLDERYDNQPCAPCDPLLGTPIVVTSPGTTTLPDISLVPGGRISGTVQAQGGGPLNNVTVRIYDSAGSQVASAQTNALGQYTTSTGLATGTYFAASVNGIGYIDEVFNGVPAGPDIQCPACVPTNGVPIAVTLGATTSGRDFSLAVGGSISGTITTGGGTAAPVESAADSETPAAPTGLADVAVRVYNSRNQQVTTAVTNAQGVYTAIGLPSDTYFATTSNTLGFIDELWDNGTCLSSCSVIDGRPIQVTAGATTPGVDFDLAPGGRVSGVVTGPNGPLGNVTVTIFNAAGFPVSSGPTNQLGEYTTRAGLPDGVYFSRTSNSAGFVDELYDNSSCAFCQANTGTPIPVTAGVTTTGINYDLVRGGRVSGVVTDAAGNPLSNVSVTFSDATGQTVGSGFSNVTGAYLSTAMPAGTFFARTSNTIGFINETYNDIACEGACAPGTGEGIAVTLGAVTPGKSFSLRRGGRVSGTVTGGGTPLVSVMVQILDSGGNAVASTLTNSLGQYTTTTGLSAGVYFARVFNSLGYFNEAYNNIKCATGQCNNGTGFAVALNATTTGIDFDLEPGGRVTGIVTDASTGAPLPNVGVRITSPTSGQGSSGSTDAAGRYLSSEGLVSGKYYVSTFNSIGYIDENYDNQPCAPSCTGAGLVDVVVGQTTDSINFALARGGRVTGTVRRADTSAALMNVTVEIYPVGTTTRAAVGISGPNGTYRTGGGLAAGRYFARTLNAQGMLNAVSAEFEVTPPNTISGIDFLLGKGGQISGVVKDENGEGLPRINVAIFDSSSALVSTGITNATGFYIVNQGLPAGIYYAITHNVIGYVDERYDDTVCTGCRPILGTPITVAAGVITGGIDFTLVRGGRVAGVVTDAATGEPLLNVNVVLRTATGVSNRSARTDSSGRYEIKGVAPGTYYAATANFIGYLDEVFDNVSCPYNTICSVTTGTPIPVALDVLTPNINFALVRGGVISGVVTDTGSPPAPVGGATVFIFDGLGRRVSAAGTDGAGRYTVPAGLPTGTYYAVAGANGHLKELFGELPCFPNCVATDGSPIAVTLGNTTPNINFTLAPGGSISGRITDTSSGTPLATVTVLVYTADGKTNVSTGFSDGSGVYRTRDGIAPGNYLLRTINGAGRIDEVYDNVVCGGLMTDCVGSATPVTVVGTATTPNINFALAPGARISGSVRDATTGAPLTSVRVTIYDSNGRSMGVASTDAEGQYVLANGLPDGQYFAATFNGLDYIDEAYDDVVCVQGVCNPTLTTPIVIAGGASVAGIDFALARGGRIAGLVRGMSGGTIVPLSGVPVEIYGANGLKIATAFTNEAGIYELAGGLPAGNYFVKTNNTLGVVDQLYNNLTCVDCPVLIGTPVAVSVGNITDGINFVLQTGSLLNGTVFDSTTGQPLPSAFVVIRGADGVIVATTQTNDDGLYSISLPPGTYYVQTGANQGYTTTIYTAAGADRLRAKRARPPAPASDTPTARDEGACPRGLCDVELGTSLVLAPGGTTGQIDLGVVPCGTITLLPLTLPNATLGGGYSLTLTATGGTAPYRFSVIDGALPPGFTLNADTGYIAAAANVAGFASFTLSVSDQLGCSATSEQSITISEPSPGTGPGPGPGPAPAPPAPTFVVTPGDIAAPARGLSASVQVTASASDAAWSAASNAPWITFSSGGGTGTGSVTLNVARNNTLVARHGTATVAGQTITVSQRENGVPGTPQNLASGVTSFRARFSWSAPIEGGDAVSYRLEIGRAAGGTEQTFTSATTAFELPLLPAGRYFARVLAINEFGVSIASQEHEIVVRENGSSPPMPPVNVVGLVSGGVLTVIWDPPIGGNAPEGYRLEAGTQPGGTDLGFMDLAGRTFNYAGVPAGVFHIRVRAFTGLGGLGDASREVVVTAGSVPSRPGVPLALTQTVLGTSVVLTWLAPTDGGAPSSYVIEVGRERGATDIGALDTITPVTAVRFDNVAPGVYWVRVRGRNLQGLGGATADIRVVVQ